MEHYKLVFTKGDSIIEISSHEKEWVEKKEREYKINIDQLLTKKNDIEIFPKEKKDKQLIKESNKDISGMQINEFYRKFIHERKGISRSDIATFFVYYLTKIKKQEDTNATEIKNLFKEVSYPQWNKLNISDILSKAKRKAFLNNVGATWTLTITGEDYILNILSEPKE